MESAGDFYLEAKWQRCIVHFYRNVFTVVPRGKVNDVARMLKAIHASEDKAAAQEKAEAVVKKLKGRRLHQAARVVENGIADTLAYYDFPDAHWPRIRTNNPHPPHGWRPERNRPQTGPSETVAGAPPGRTMHAGLEIRGLGSSSSNIVLQSNTIYY